VILLVGALWAVEIQGQVLERGTADPIPEVTLRVGDTTWSTTADGRFTVDLPAGTPVDFLAGGYTPYTEPVPEAGPWRVYLRRGVAALEVVVEARRDPPVVAEQHLDRERVLETPGTFEDPVRLLQALAGVAQTPEYAPTSGDISVRGSQPGDNRFYLDGIELPYLYHYNQYSSVFHTRLLDELSLYPSTFGGAWGDTLGAVIDTRSTWTRPARVHGSANLNLVMGGASAEVPVSEAWTLRASGRRSYLDLIDSDSLQYTLFPVFYDWFARAEHTRGDHRVGIATFGAGDAYDRYAGEPTLLDPWEQSENPVFTWRQDFQVLAVQHRDLTPGGSFQGHVSFTASRADGDLPLASSHDRTFTLQAREDTVARVSDALDLAAGAELRLMQEHLVVVADRPWPEVAREAPFLARGLSTDDSTIRAIGGLYAEPRLDLGSARLLPAVRLDVDSLTRRLRVDPRLGVRWQIGEWTRLRAAAGRYGQFPDTWLASPVLGGGTEPVSATSTQVAAGFDQTVAQRLEFGVDGWARWMRDLLVADPGEAPITGVEGRSLGLSITSRYRLREVFFTWLSVDLSRTTRTIDGVESPGDYDQPFAVNYVASWTFAPTWNLGLRYRVSAGLPVTEVVDGVYDAVSDQYLPVYGPRNGSRLPAYQKVDLHLEKRFELRRGVITPYLEAWYVPKGSNTMYLAWSYDYDEVQGVSGPGFIPLVGVRGEI